MLFNSLEFFIFFIIVYGLYLVSSHRWQNRLLLVASYWFYAAWDWRFLSLLGISTVVDYYCGQRIYASSYPKVRKKYLFISVFVNLLILGYFKYCNFFAGNLAALFNTFGYQPQMRMLNIILPVGISFYTFQTMSYTIDIYHRRMEPRKGFFDFALFVAFFPQLVAGPIERAKHLLPQIHRPRVITLEAFYEGCFLVFWGMFQKVFIADNLAKIVNPIFAFSGPYKIDLVLLGVYAFAFQIFCDFAGYSNIARGICKCMGFDIMINFDLPYFSTNPREFWRRWHISLSTWLRDYLYIPLGGNKWGMSNTFRNLMMTMLLGGLWHGASWTFVVWGAFHGLLLAAHRSIEFISAPLKNLKGIIPKQLSFWIRVVVFFHLTCFGWLIFRAESMGQVYAMLTAVFFQFHELSVMRYMYIIAFIFPYLCVLLMVQIFQFINRDLMAVYKFRDPFKVMFYFVCSLMLIIYGETNAQDFIYFQF